jgi:hypothetical protein
MTGNAFEDTLVDFRRWAGTTGRKLYGAPEADAAELGMLFGLMPDYLRMESPSELVAGQLTQLLLDLYPRKVSVLDGEDTGDTIPALRDLTTYLADTRAITTESAQAMQRELDEIEPRFADAVMDPANWGPARATVQAMDRDGVDLNDRDAVDRWIGQQNPEPLAGDHADPLTMSAGDVVRVGMFGTEEDLEAKLTSWLTGRTHEDAARELLSFAANEPAAVRTAAVAVVSRLGAAAEPAWREALNRPELRCYAKPALLAQLAVRDPGSAVPAELKLATEDVAWYVADTFGPLTHLDLGSGTFPFDMSQLADAGWTASNEAIFDAMARLDHPDAERVLAMLGKHADNKQTAKAARRAAHKAASRGRA